MAEDLGSLIEAATGERVGDGRKLRGCAGRKVRGVVAV
jgi:hypothetical protein